MEQINREILRQFAAKYIWWKTPGEALQYPDRVIAQVMDIGDYDDVQKLVARVGDEYLRQVLARGEIGQFSARSWAYVQMPISKASGGTLPGVDLNRSSDLQDRMEEP